MTVPEVFSALQLRLEQVFSDQVESAGETVTQTLENTNEPKRFRVMLEIG